MSGKLFKDIPRMFRDLNIIKQYNNFKQLGANEDIEYLRDKIYKLYEIKDSNKLIEEFQWCANMINMYLNEIDPEFKQYILKEERKREQEEF